MIDKKYYVLIYFIVLGIIAIYLNDMFAESTEKGYVNITSLKTLSSGIKEAWYILLTFCFGAFYGANIIALLDNKKRLQGGLIFLSSFIVASAYNHIITLRPEIFFLGLIVSASISYKLKTGRGKNPKYPVAILIATFLAIFGVGVAFINYMIGLHLVNKSNIYTILWYFLLTAAFGIVFYKFSRYEASNSNVFVVGPKDSGKTVFMCGCYERAMELDKTIGILSRHLDEAIKELRNGNWPPGTINPKSYKFSYEQGLLFIKDVTIHALDYRGELLENEIELIVEYIRRKSESPKIEPNNIIEQIGDEIYNANTLIFIIDAERIELDDYIQKYYLRILDEISGKQYYLVVTKSDKFFSETDWWLESYQELSDKILQELERTEIFFREIKNEAEGVIPVFFRETKDKKPSIENNKFTTLGFDQVLEVMGK